MPGSREIKHLRARWRAAKLPRNHRVVPVARPRSRLLLARVTLLARKVAQARPVSLELELESLAQRVSQAARGEPATDLEYKVGPYNTDSYALALTCTVYYPTDAEPPLAGIAIIPGFLNSRPEMADWGPFYASYGMVVVVTNTDPSAPRSSRATTLLNGVKALKAENTESGSPLFGKLSDRFGTSGYSMGGGGTTIASGQDSSLKVSIGLAPWGGSGDNVKVATLLLCGSVDTTAPCSMSSPVFRAIDDSTPKMQVVMQGASHFAWFGPQGAEFGKSGMIALAFANLFLEGDERWKPALLMADGMTNIQ
jgi:hypothetical protein